MDELTDRLRIIDTTSEEIRACHDRALADGMRDFVVLILDARDVAACAAAKALGIAGVEAAHEYAVKNDRVLCNYIAVERGNAVALLAESAPQLASVVPHPVGPGLLAVAVLSAAGSTCVILKLREGGATRS